MPIYLDCERTVLYKRIDDRVDSYLARGLVDEVASLHSRGYAFDLPAMSGIGYRQIGDYLQGLATLAEAVQRTKWDTHAFVRHQGNWFRRHKEAYRIDATESRPTKEALRVIHDFLAFAPPGRGRV
jgi:tRNA dimethylallyltransferase